MNSHIRNTNMPRRATLAIALAMGLGLTGLAQAQSTTGAIFGNAPAVSDGTITVTSNNGIERTVRIGADGKFVLPNLPLGVYTVTLKNNGTVLDRRSNVGIHVGAGTQVDFSAAVQNLTTVQVTANTLPVIDVTSVSSSTVITARELETLPLGHSAEAIALLAPGAVAGSAYFGNAVSFGGAGVTENAYYVNGYNTTEPYRNTGGFQLPYGSIAQQQTYTGGYSAKYGRSDGGVINQVGKRGTDEWHFGGRFSWAPRALAAGGKDLYYPVQNTPDGWTVVKPALEGKLRRYRGDNKSWNTTYAGYVGGPLVEDKLYAFFSVETSENRYNSISSVVPPTTQSIYGSHSTHTYGKLDWNIDANNILEVTSLVSDSTTGKGATYNYDYDTHTSGTFRNARDAQTDEARFLSAKYTSYIGDNAVLDVVWGQGKFKNYYQYPGNSKLPYIYNPTGQNPDYLPSGSLGIVNDQTRLYSYSPNARNDTRGLRADFTYQLGNHQLGVGIDDMTYGAHDQGRGMSGPGYMWFYMQGKPNEDISEGQGVGAPGGDGYYVAKYIVSSTTSMSMEQKAWYIQDVWNLSDTLQLNLGLRNDHFVNKNNDGVAFVDEKNQWEPRLGFSWDVHGDSSLKIYGNAGRYYLALPNSVAERAANPSTFTYEYFNYTGIDANGAPTGLTPLGPGPVSSNNELGQAKDPHTVTATDLKAQYQDEFILGFDKTLGEHWVYGAKASFRELKTAIDDVCDMGKLEDKLTAMGLDASQYDWADPGCRIFNPGQTNSFDVRKIDGSGYVSVDMSTADWGFSEGAKRKYYALDLYLAHPFDGKWMARVDYTFSRSWGNTEGQVRSDLGQDDVSKTQSWDSWQLMDHAYGYLPNHRRHQLKARAAYQITSEWLVSGTLRVQSGTPLSCLGYYGPDGTDPVGYKSSYYWCAGNPVSPGSIGSSPWTRQLNMGIQYSPDFADNKLAFKLDVFNLLNEQKATQIIPDYETGKGVISNTYGAGLSYETPRYVRLSVNFDY